MIERFNIANRRRTPRGQSLIVAVIVLFVLLFIGGIFVALVARNLSNSGRSRDTVRALALAEAGVRYCDQFLMNSPEGADWRPAPTPVVNAQDPDRAWLQGGDWTRVELTDGRALVRVTYQPQFITDPTDPLGQRQILDPLSRRIKIESIGRPGFLDPSDPTTFLNTPAPRLRRELVAYKAIGLTDYLFYVTNRWNDTKAHSDIGVPPVGVHLPTGYTGPQFPLGMKLGDQPTRLFGTASGQYYLPGAPMHINNDVTFWGSLLIAASPYNGEGVYSSGNIHVQANDPNNLPVFLNVATGATGPIKESGDTQFSTFGGLFRDSSPNPDPFGYSRSVSRLEPPLLDVVDPATGLTRARMLTQNSGPILNGINTGQVGMGAGLYIDNFNPGSEENSKTVDMRTLWLNPYGHIKHKDGAWNGPYFIPTAAFLEFGYPVVQARDADSNLVPDQFVATPGIRVIRDPSDRHFRDPAGRFASTTEVDFTFFIYKPVGRRPVLKLESEFFRSALRGAPFNMTEKQIDSFLPEFNGTIFTEASARVRGLLPTKMNIPIRRQSASEPNSPTDAQIYDMVNSPAVTLVSNNNIYIEGSLIREAPDSMIALLAQNYVCVNTTMFMGMRGDLPFEPRSGDQSGEPPQYATIDVNESAKTPPFTLDWLYGDNPSLYVDKNGNAVGQQLMLSHGVPGNPSGGGATSINLFINDWYPRTNNNPRYQFALPGLPPDVYQIRSEGTDDGFRKDIFQILPKPNNSTYFYTNDTGYTFPQGLRNTFRPAIDPNFTQTAGSQPYLFNRADVVPSDVRIEALMYAQNGSFFVIPGVPFNDDASDTPEVAAARAAQAGMAAGSLLRPVGPTWATNKQDMLVNDQIPFYRDPIDCRITIVGAIAQNKTASIGDQAAWMQLWGYVPEVYGSTGHNQYTSPTEVLVPRQHQQVDEVGLNSGDQRTNDEKTARITRGIRYLYDPALVTPYQGYSPSGKAFRRDDAYFDPNTNGILAGHSDVGRVLPPLPRLPVCPGFVYYGEVRG